MKYVLVIIASIYGESIHTSNVEFKTRNLCELAKAEIEANKHPDPRALLALTCVGIES